MRIIIAIAVLTIARILCIQCMHTQFMGGLSVAGETTDGAVDRPGGPSMAAIVSLGGPTMATKFAVDRPGGPIMGRPSVA